jgi:hypothetical protein
MRKADHRAQIATFETPLYQNIIGIERKKCYNGHIIEIPEEIP